MSPLPDPIEYKAQEFTDEHAGSLSKTAYSHNLFVEGHLLDLTNIIYIMKEIYEMKKI